MDPTNKFAGHDSPNHQHQPTTNSAQIPNGQAFPPPNSVNPVAPSNSYHQQHATTPARFQGLQHQQNLVHPRQGVLGPSGSRQSPFFQPVALSGGLGSTSSLGAKSVTERSDKQPAAHIEVKIGSRDEEWRRGVPAYKRYTK